MSLKHFSSEELLQIVELLGNADLTSPQTVSALLGGVDRQYRLQIPAGDTPNVHLLTILNTLNETHLLASGELPLRIFLLNAIMLSTPRIESSKLKILLEKLDRNTLWDKLTEIIQSSAVESDQLRHFYHLCLPQHVIVPKTPPDNDVRTMIGNLGGIGQSGERGQPVLLFAYLVALKNRDFRIFTEIELWIEQAGHILGITLNLDEIRRVAEQKLTARDEQDFGTTHLMVMVTPETVDQRRIQVEMYWWRLEDHEQGHVRCGGLAGDTYELSQLPDLLEHVLAERIHCTIELFLPHSLMGIDLEFPSERLRSPVVHHRVVRRFAERQDVFNCTSMNEKTRELLKAKHYWEIKWREFSSGCRDMNYYHKWIDREELSETDVLYIGLVNAPHLCCTSPSFAPKNQLDEVLFQNLRAGVPICFWSNEETVDIRSGLSECLTDQSGSFLKTIRELQLEGLQSRMATHIGRLLYLLWDDPERPFPGAQAGILTEY